MMLKLTIKDILRQKSFGAIAVISGVLLGLVYYFLTLSSVFNHFAMDIAASPQYIVASIGLTVVVAVLGGINIALVVYNIKAQRMNLQKSSSSAIFGGALAAFTPGCPACTTSLTAVLGIMGGFNFPTSRIGAQVYFNSCTIIFNLVGNAKYQQG